MYQVNLRPRAQRELARLPRRDETRLVSAILRLGAQPRPGQSLKLTDSIYRLRVGRFSVIYQIDDGKRLVEVGKVARREKDTYDRIGELF